MPCAGASATMYLRWRRLMPSWIVVRPLELPGRGNRLNEIPQHNYMRLIEILCDEVAVGSSDRYALFGHSMGALLAYGICHGLRSRNLPLPVELFVSGCAAPAYQDSERYNKIRGEAGLIADLSRQGGTPAEVFDNPELLAMTLDLLQTDYRVCGSFRHMLLPSLPVPIHVFGGRSDEIGAHKLNEWRHESAEKFTLDWFDGGHFFLRQSEAWFLRVLQNHLANSQLEMARGLSAVT